MNFSLPLLLDGATGTNLMKSGMPFGVCVEQWVLENPEVLARLQKAYAAAGSGAVMAPTFEANRYKLSRFGFGERVEEFNQSLVRITRGAVGPDVLVAGDISPTGLMVEPFGETTFEELLAIYREQAFALLKAGVDYIAAETMLSLTEARAALLAAKETGLPVTVTLTVEPNGKTLSGCDAAAGLFTLAAMGADAVGINCSTGPEAVLAALKAASPYVDKPMIAKPNAGLPIEGRPGEYDVTPEKFAGFVPAFLEAGAGLIGGCCGTTPETIEHLRKALEGRRYERHAVSTCPFVRCASERSLFEVTREQVKEAVDIDCDENFYETLLSLSGEGAAARIHLESIEDVSEFLQSAYLAAVPLILSSADADVLEAALKVYQGVALVDGKSGASSDRLDALSKLYGAVIV